MKHFPILTFLFLFVLAAPQDFAQKKPTGGQGIDSKLFDQLKFRSIGPAFISGRIADLAIDPVNENV
jgi:hypothetical protein